MLVEMALRGGDGGQVVGRTLRRALTAAEGWTERREPRGSGFGCVNRLESGARARRESNEETVWKRRAAGSAALLWPEALRGQLRCALCTAIAETDNQARNASRRPGTAVETAWCEGGETAKRSDEECRGGKTAQRASPQTRKE